MTKKGAEEIAKKISEGKTKFDHFLNLLLRTVAEVGYFLCPEKIATDAVHSSELGCVTFFV